MLRVLNFLLAAAWVPGWMRSAVGELLRAERVLGDDRGQLIETANRTVGKPVQCY